MIKELTPIRFALCMMIFCCHAYSCPRLGAPAVAAFFILSGFCLTLGYRERILSGAFNYIDYLKVRFAKLYTIHWITLLAFILILHHIGSRRVLLVNFLLLQSWIPDRAYYFSYNAIAWYLSTALFAYICFPKIITMLHKIPSNHRIGLIIAILIGYGAVAFAMPREDYHAMLYVNPVSRCIDFVIGIYLAEWYTGIKTDRIQRYGRLLDIGSILSFAALIMIGLYLPEVFLTIGAFFWIPACGLILCTCLASKTLSPLSKILDSNAIQKTTACSYSIMMWSICIIQLFRKLDIANDLLGGVSIFIVTYLISMFSYWLIEKKLTKWVISKLKI